MSVYPTQKSRRNSVSELVGLGRRRFDLLDHVGRVGFELFVCFEEAIERSVDGLAVGVDGTYLLSTHAPLTNGGSSTYSELLIVGCE